jgi:hypothetical protein
MSKLINRSAVRALLLEQYAKWGHSKKRHNISSSVVNETLHYLEDSANRHIVAVAAQGFPGRKGGARRCARYNDPHQARPTNGRELAE